MSTSTPISTQLVRLPCYHCQATPQDGPCTSKPGERCSRCSAKKGGSRCNIGGRVIDYQNPLHGLVYVGMFRRAFLEADVKAIDPDVRHLCARGQTIAQLAEQLKEEGWVGRDNKTAEDAIGHTGWKLLLPHGRWRAVPTLKVAKRSKRAAMMPMPPRPAPPAPLPSASMASNIAAPFSSSSSANLLSSSNHHHSQGGLASQQSLGGSQVFGLGGSSMPAMGGTGSRDVDEDDDEDEDGVGEEEQGSRATSWQVFGSASGPSPPQATSRVPAPPRHHHAHHQQAAQQHPSQTQGAHHHAHHRQPQPEQHASQTQGAAHHHHHHHQQPQQYPLPHSQFQPQHPPQPQSQTQQQPPARRTRGPPPALDDLQGAMQRLCGGMGVLSVAGGQQHIADLHTLHAYLPTLRESGEIYADVLESRGVRVPDEQRVWREW